MRRGWAPLVAPLAVIGFSLFLLLWVIFTNIGVLV